MYTLALMAWTSTTISLPAFLHIFFLFLASESCRFSKHFFSLLIHSTCIILLYTFFFFFFFFSDIYEICMFLTSGFVPSSYHCRRNRTIGGCFVLELAFFVFVHHTIQTLSFNLRTIFLNITIILSKFISMSPMLP